MKPVAAYIKFGGRRGDKMILTTEGEKYIREHFATTTNRELAKALGISIERMRVFLHERKMFRMEVEYWTEEQIQFLKDNYQTVGDKEMEILFILTWPKKKGWSFKHIEKKRLQLGLKRTPEQIIAVKKYYYCPGGQCDVIGKYSASVHLKDGYVAQAIVGTKGNKDKDMEAHILRYHPELIKLKRTQLLLNRQIKKAS